MPNINIKDVFYRVDLISDTIIKLSIITVFLDSKDHNKVKYHLSCYGGGFSEEELTKAPFFRTFEDAHTYLIKVAAERLDKIMQLTEKDIIDKSLGGVL